MGFMSWFVLKSEQKFPQPREMGEAPEGWREPHANNCRDYRRERFDLWLAPAGKAARAGGGGDPFDRVTLGRAHGVSRNGEIGGRFSRALHLLVPGGGY